MRTGGPGAAVLSLLVVPRGESGVTTKLIKTTYSTAAGTALVLLDKARRHKSLRAKTFPMENEGARPGDQPPRQGGQRVPVPGRKTKTNTRREGGTVQRKKTKENKGEKGKTSIKTRFKLKKIISSTDCF